MGNYVKYLNIAFEKTWLENLWKDYRKYLVTTDPNLIDLNQVKYELNLHPLIKDIAPHLDINKDEVDLDKISNNPTFNILNLLGRDIYLLKDEIMARGKRFINDLQKANEYESQRFTLLIAAGYKLLGYKVEFLPTNDNKTADLHVWNEVADYIVECKMRNQSQSDKDRYILVTEAAIELFKMFVANNIKDTTVQIILEKDIQLNNGFLLQSLVVTILNAPIFKHTFDHLGDTVNVKVFKTTDKLLKMLGDDLNINKISYMGRALDTINGIDRQNRNVLIINKKVKESDLYLDLLNDANMKEKQNRKLIVYYDLGRGYDNWPQSIAKKVFDDINNNISLFPNIDCLFTLQSLPKYRDGLVILEPSIHYVGQKSKLGDAPDKLNLFGVQGDTGIENYLKI